MRDGRRSSVLYASLLVTAVHETSPQRTAFVQIRRGMERSGRSVVRPEVLVFALLAIALIPVAGFVRQLVTGIPIAGGVDVQQQHSLVLGALFGLCLVFCTPRRVCGLGIVTGLVERPPATPTATVRIELVEDGAAGHALFRTVSLERMSTRYVPAAPIARFVTEPFLLGE